MADIKYKGITTYIKQGENVKDKLNVLATAIEPLTIGHNDVIDHDFEVGAEFQDIIESDEYQHIERFTLYFYVNEFDLPGNTPKEYQSATIEAVTIKDIPMYKIYVPITSKRIEFINDLSSSFRNLMLNLFGDDVLSMKSRAGFEFEDFSETRENIMVSIERFNK